jgi:cephalosporin hydroxylase
MDAIERFEREKSENIQKLGASPELGHLGLRFLNETGQFKYTYNFSWLGRPIIQMPQDIMALQEIIWNVQPDLVVETGIAHGGSLILSASLLELLGGDGLVVGVDIDIRPHARAAIESHSLGRRIKMIQGSSIAEAVAAQVFELARNRQRPLVILDSNHTHAHVLRELELYSPLVKRGSYLVVFDTVIEDMPSGSFPDRPWGHGDNPKTAVHAFLSKNDRFRIDEAMNAKLLISVAPDGYLECIKD